VTEVIRFRLPNVLAADPCERCGTELALVEWQEFVPLTGEPVDGPSERAWCEYELWTHPETGQQVARSFRPHSRDRCEAVRNPGSEPCESCGTPIVRRDPQPDDAVRYEGLPRRAGVWDEQWQNPREGVQTKAWHSPQRCREARQTR
jgi:hypothetical protein